jgi:hypothetical protein
MQVLCICNSSSLWYNVESIFHRIKKRNKNTQASLDLNLSFIGSKPQKHPKTRLERQIAINFSLHGWSITASTLKAAEDRT